MLVGRYLGLYAWPAGTGTFVVTPGLGLRAEVYDGSGNKLNVGPLLNWLSFDYKLAFDQIGSWSGSIPASDPAAASLSEGYELQFFREGEGLIWRGIIGKTSWRASPNETYTLELSGLSIAEQISWLSTNTGFVLSSASPTSALTALLAGTGWSVGAVASTTNTISLRIDGLSRWEAIVRVAQYFGWHVREDNLNKALDMGPFGASSGLRFRHRDHPPMPLTLNPDLLPLESLEDIGSSEGLYNRVQVLGGGTSWAQLTLGSLQGGTPVELLSYVPEPFGYHPNGSSHVDDQSFEQTAFATNWVASNGAITQVATPKEGTYAAKFTVSASGAWNMNNGTTDPSSFPGATAGLKYKLGMWVAGSGTGVGKSVFLRMTEHGGASGDASTDSAAITLTSAFQYLEVERTVVQNDRTEVDVYLRSNGSEVAGNLIIIDQAKFFRSSSFPYGIEHAVDLQGNVYHYLEDSPSVVLHGKRECVLVAKDIYPLTGTIADHSAAANTLAILGGAWLGRRQAVIRNYRWDTFGLTGYVAGAVRARPGDTARVQFQGLAQEKSTGVISAWRSIDTDLYLLSMARRFSADGTDRWTIEAGTVDQAINDPMAQFVQVVSNVGTLENAAASSNQIVTFNYPRQSVGAGGSAYIPYRYDTSKALFLRRAILQINVETGPNNVTVGKDGVDKTAAMGGPWAAPVSTLIDVTTLFLSIGPYFASAPVAGYLSVGVPTTTSVVTATLTFEMAYSPNA